MVAPGSWEREVALFSSLLTGTSVRHTAPVPHTYRHTLWGKRGGTHRVRATLEPTPAQPSLSLQPMDLIKPSVVYIIYLSLHTNYPKTYWLGTTFFKASVIIKV